MILSELQYCSVMESCKYVCCERKVKRENQQDATNSMFIIKLLSQHVSGIVMPIIMRIRPCPTACGVLPVRLSYLMFPSPYRQNIACSRTRSYSHDDGHNDARNML